MSAATLPAPPTSPTRTPRPLRWTCDEFHRLGDLGLFEGRGARLIDGVILEEGPMNPPHAICIGLVHYVLQTAFGVGWWPRIQLPLLLGLHTDPLPDAAVVPGSPRDYAAHPATAALVVEVADSSLHFDLHDKRRLYAEAGIAEYWVIDVTGRVLHVFRDPHANDYRAHLTLGVADSVQPLAAPAAVRVADLLP